MHIIDTNFNYSGTLTKRSSTNYIILHHRAGDGDVNSIHSQHLGQGYAGIGYHFYVRKDGSVYRGRPINTIGAHCLNYNRVSVGVCFEGNFEQEMPTKEQIKSGIDIVNYLLNIYPHAKVVRHKDLSETLCPGKNFDINEILNNVEVGNVEELITVNDIVWELSNRGIITDKELWLKKLSTDQNSYWLARKFVNYIRSKGV